MDERQTQTEQHVAMRPEDLHTMFARGGKAEHEELLKRLLGPELEGWFLPERGRDPYEDLAEQLYQLRNMIRRALPVYFYEGIERGMPFAMGIARLMQVSGSLARVLKQGPPKVITVPVIDVSDSKTVRGGRKTKGAQD